MQHPSSFAIPCPQLYSETCLSVYLHSGFLYKKFWTFFILWWQSPRLILGCLSVIPRPPKWHSCSNLTQYRYILSTHAPALSLPKTLQASFRYCDPDRNDDSDDYGSSFQQLLLQTEIAPPEFCESSAVWNWWTMMVMTLWEERERAESREREEREEVYSGISDWDPGKFQIRIWYILAGRSPDIPYLRSMCHWIFPVDILNLQSTLYKC